MSEEAKEFVETTAKTRSPIERILVWGVIAILGILVVIEFRSQKNFNGALQWLSDNEMRSKTLSEVRDALSGASEFDAKTNGSDSARGFKWFSVYNTYKLIVELDGEGESAKFTGYYDPEAMKAVEQEMLEGAADPASAEQNAEEEL